MAAQPSSNQLVERFSRASTGAKIGIFFGIAALLGLAYWYVFYSDLSDQLASGKATARKLAADEVKLKERQKQYRDLLAKKKAIQDGLAKNQIALPASSELPSFFVSLQSQAIAANVQLIKWSRESEIPVETYVKVPVRMEVRGDFYQIVQYFKLLYETRRIITVEDLFIGDAKKDGDQMLLTARFFASTFRQADAPPKTTKDEPVPAAGAKPAAAPAEPAKPGAKPAPAAAPKTGKSP